MKCNPYILINPLADRSAINPTLLFAPSDMEAADLAADTLNVHTGFICAYTPRAWDELTSNPCRILDRYTVDPHPTCPGDTAA